MEDEVYETLDIYKRTEIDTIAKFLDDEIGTDYEINESASGEPDEFYIVVTDLTSDEVDTIRDFEREVYKTKVDSNAN